MLQPYAAVVTPARSLDPRTRQAELNRSVAGHWELFETHRRRVTELILSLAPSTDAVLCVVGAGNCNDLDLDLLLDVSAEIHLIDVDTDALANGADRQGMGGSPRLRLHGGHDVTGILGRLARWDAGPRPTNPEIDDCLRELAAGALPVGIEPGSAHVAVSAALLSQATGAAVRVLGVDHPRSLEVALAIRDAHLRFIAGLVRPGGSGLIVTDLASSDMVDGLVTAPAETLSELMDEVMQSGPFHAGTNPHGIEASLRQLPGVDGGIERIARYSPWLWRLGRDKVQLTYAMAFRAGVTSVQTVAPSSSR